MWALFLATSLPIWLLHCCSLRSVSLASTSYSCIICPVSLCRWQGLHMQLSVWFTFQLQPLRVWVHVCVFAFMCGLPMHTRFLLKVSVILRTVYSGRALRSWLGRWVCVFLSMWESHQWDHQMMAVGARMSPRGELSRSRNTTSYNKTWQVCYPSLLSALSLVVSLHDHEDTHCPHRSHETLYIFTARHGVFLSFLHIKKIENVLSQEILLISPVGAVDNSEAAN